MESFHRLAKAHMKVQQEAAFYSEKSESETNIAGIANATGAMEKQLVEVWTCLCQQRNH